MLGAAQGRHEAKQGVGIGPVEQDRDRAREGFRVEDCFLDFTLNFLW